MSEDECEPPSLGPAAFGLMQVGTLLPRREKPAQPIQVLNARGMPARIRKKNKLFFDDDIINDTKALRQSPQKKIATKTSPIKLPLHSPSKHLKKRKGTVSKYLKSPSSASKPSLMADLRRTPKSSGTSSAPVSASKPSTSTATVQPSATKVTSPPGSPSTTISPTDRAMSQRIGLCLRNL